jgi:hypothetical protein
MSRVSWDSLAPSSAFFSAWRSVLDGGMVGESEMRGRADKSLRLAEDSRQLGEKKKRPLRDGGPIAIPRLGAHEMSRKRYHLGVN